MKILRDGNLVEANAQKKAEINADVDNSQLREWSNQMKKLDHSITGRTIEDIFDVLSDEQKAALPKVTRDKFAARKTLRGQKP